MPVGPGRNKEFHTHILYGFQAHKIYTKVVSDPAVPCSVVVAPYQAVIPADHIVRVKVPAGQKIQVDCRPGADGPVPGRTRTAGPSRERKMDRRQPQHSVRGRNMTGDDA
jgi:hypothetical protein